MSRIAMTLIGAGLGLVLANVLALVLAPAPATWAGVMVMGGALLGGQFAPRIGHRRPRR